MPTILIVGRAFSGITNYLQAHGYRYGVLRDHLDSAILDEEGDYQVLCDFSTHQSVLESLENLPQQPDAIITIYEKYVLPAAWIAEHLNVPGMPPQAAIACTDKWIMRQAFAKAPERLNPDFTIVHSEKDLVQFANNHGFPLMLKPANLVKSLLVSQNNSLDELLKNYRHMLSSIGTIYAKYAQNRQPAIIVEEFLSGSMHTIAAFVDDTGRAHLAQDIADLQTAREVGFEDNFLYSRSLPSQLSSSHQASLRHTAKLGMAALGMKSSPAHVELVLTPDGPRIIEIGARMGGYRERMYDLANGINMVDAAVTIALGGQPHLTPKKDEPCAVLELFPLQPGIFVEVEHADEIARLSSCVYCSIKVKPGDFVGKAMDGYKRCAIIVLSHTDSKQFAMDVEFVNRMARVITKVV